MEPNDEMDCEQVCDLIASIIFSIKTTLHLSGEELKASFKKIDPLLTLSSLNDSEIIEAGKFLLMRFEFVLQLYAFWTHLSSNTPLPESLEINLIFLLTKIHESSTPTLSPLVHPAFDELRHRKLYSQTPITPRHISITDGFQLYSSFLRNTFQISRLFKEKEFESSQGKDVISYLLFDLECLWMEESALLIPTRSFLNVFLYYFVKLIYFLM